ncbi:MAG: DUF3025 domain-containing protein [Azoarcus sp.]|jgi:hypothetical protein|nr:DUF3025 domain-containing protein [Azoarcus sp.]
MTPDCEAPAALAGRLLYEPIAELLARFSDTTLPDAGTLSMLLQHTAPDARGPGNMPIRFVPPPGVQTPYEAHVFETGEVPTRPNDWHDFFNALAWCAWPQTKSRCNALHIREMQAHATPNGRGPIRDTLTQLDECGIVVTSSSAAITALLAAHAWEEAFWERRAQLAESTRFLVIGHGIWDQLRRPFFGLCAKAIYRVVEPGWLALPAAAAQAECDAWLAAHLSHPATVLTPRALSPLPLLGIPGLTPDSECRDYYRDTRQFRPQRAR